MELGLIPFISGALTEKAIDDLLECNDHTVYHGLTLTRSQAAELVETREDSLRAGGLIEFGGGVIDKLIMTFSDSPYLYMHNYAPTLHELIEIFYCYRGETAGKLTDDELIEFMKTAFDGVCGGSLELLAERELYRLAENLRFGRDRDFDDDYIPLDRGEEFDEENEKQA